MLSEGNHCFENLAQKRFIFVERIENYCDECVFARQNVFRGPNTHLIRPEYYFESQHLRLINLVNCCFQMRFQNKF